MIKKISELLLKNDRKYFLLALILAAAFGLIHFSHLSDTHETSTAAREALTELQQAEAQMGQQFSSKESIEQFFKEHPDAKLLISILSISGILLFSGGLCIDLLFFFSGAFRKKIAQPSETADPVHWHYSMLLKLILLFMSASLGVSVFLALIRSAVFKSLSMNALILIETTIVDVVCVFMIIYLLKSYGGSWRSLGFHRPERGYLREVLAGIGMYLAIFPLFIASLAVLVLVAKLTGYEPPAHPLVYIFLEEETANPLLIYYSIFLASIIAPIIEEIFFRGFLYPVVKNYWGAFWAIAVTGAVFAAIHQNLFAFFPIMMLGVALAYIYEKRKSLVASITLHLIHNSIFLGYFFLVKKVLNIGF